MKIRVVASSAVFLSIFACGAPTFAQDVVGRSIIDGRVVVLYSDRTWEYLVPSDSADCESLGSGVSFCGDKNVWSNTHVPNEEVAASYKYDDRNYGQFVIEDIGTEDGMNQEFMREAVIGFAANGLGISESDINIMNVTEQEVDGFDSETIVYGAEYRNLPVVYRNTIILLETKNHTSDNI